MWTVVERLVWGRIVLPHRDGVVLVVCRSLGRVGDKARVDLYGRHRYDFPMFRNTFETNRNHCGIIKKKRQKITGQRTVTPIPL